MSRDFGAPHTRATTYENGLEALDAIHHRWLEAEARVELLRQQFERRLMETLHGANLEGRLEQVEAGDGEFQGNPPAGGEVDAIGEAQGLNPARDLDPTDDITE